MTRPPKPSPDDAARLKQVEARVRVLRENLKELTATVVAFLDAMDRVMQGPSTVERGRNIGALCGKLEFANDCARHYGLDVPLGKLHPKKGR